MSEETEITGLWLLEIGFRESKMGLLHLGCVGMDLHALRTFGGEPMWYIDLGRDQLAIPTPATRADLLTLLRLVGAPSCPSRPSRDTKSTPATP